MSDPRKPLFPDDDDLPPLDDDEALAEDEIDSPETEPEPPAAPVHTPSAERFPPLDPASYAETREMDAPAPSPAPRRNHLRHNILAILFALGTLALLLYFGLLWINPYSTLNPLPPFTPLPQFITTTPLPPTITPVPSATPTMPTATFTPLPASALTPLPSFTPAAFPFTLSEAGVEYTQTDSVCDGSWIAGTVTDLNGDPVADYAVRISDQDGPLNATISTGDAPEIGPGGFALQLSESLQLAPYIVQLLDPNGEPVSEPYLVVSSDQCEQNQALLHFVQNR